MIPGVYLELKRKNKIIRNISLDFENKGEVYYNLALTNDGKLNNKKAAVRYYSQYLRSGPDPEKYKEVIEHVKFRQKNLSK